MRPMKENKLTVIVVVLVALGLLSCLVIFRVRVDQMAVLYHFNKAVRVIKPTIVPARAPGEKLRLVSEEGVKISRQAGWFFKFPYPVDRVKRYDQRLRVLDGQLTQQQLPDDNQVIPRVYATWRIVDPVAFESNLKSDETEVENRLKNIISNHTGIVLGQHVLSDLVNTDRKKLKFDEIEGDILQRIQKELSEQENPYGIEVCTLGITWIKLPDEATKAVFGRMQTERETISRTLLAEGKSLRDTTIAKAQEERDRILAEGAAQAKRIRTDAEAEAAHYYDVYARNEKLAIYLRRLEAIRKIAAAASAAQRPITFVVSTKTEPFSLLERGVAENLDQKRPPELDELENVLDEAKGTAPSAKE